MKKYAKGLLVLALGVCCATGYWLLKEYKHNEKNKMTKQNGTVIEDKDSKLGKENETSSEKSDIKIVSVGNILFHDTQLVGAKTEKGYDFKPSFEYIKDRIKQSDLSIGVLETTFAGGKYTGFPTFNSPDEALDAIKDCGIQVVNYANNHILDTGSSGFKRTLDVTSKKGMDYVGVRSNDKVAPYLIKEVNGMKIGIISYVFETPQNKGVKTINSIPIPKEINNLINTFNYDNLNEFYSEVDSNIKAMKEKGANFVIVSMHWGDEYNTDPNKYQKEMAQKLNALGVDLILGEHPHVIQPYEVIRGKTKNTLVTYSQGNFLSNQCYERLQNRLTEDGYVLEINLKKENNDLKIQSYEIIPTWVYREVKGTDMYTHRIVPVELGIKQREKYKLTEDAFARINQSLKDTEKILGNDAINVINFK